MGWSGGSNIASEIEEVILKYVKEDDQEEVAAKILRALEDEDWDCQDEVDIFDYLVCKETIENDLDNLDEDELDDLQKKVDKYYKKFNW